MINVYQSLPSDGSHWLSKDVPMVMPGRGDLAIRPTRNRITIAKNAGAYPVTTIEEPVYDPPKTTSITLEQVAKVDPVEAIVSSNYTKSHHDNRSKDRDSERDRRFMGWIGLANNLLCPILCGLPVIKKFL